MRIQNIGSRAVSVRPSCGKELVERGVEIANVYIGAFGEAPWYEKLLVRIDGKWRRAGTEDELQQVALLRAKGALDEKDIQPFYTVCAVVEEIKRSSLANGFAASIAICGSQTDGMVVGVSWGMLAQAIPVDEKLRDVELIIRDRGLRPERTFYFDETFVDVGYRGLKIGRDLVRVRRRMAIEIGCTFAIVRTMNPIQVNNLTSVFGIGNVVEVYSNPHDIQADRRYYLIRLGE